MNRAGKFPTSLSSGDDIMGRITEIRSTIKFQLKKVLCMGCRVGHVEMSAEDLKYVKQVSFFVFYFFIFFQVEYHTCNQFPRISAEEELAELEVCAHQVNHGEATARFLRSGELWTGRYTQLPFASFRAKQNTTTNLKGQNHPPFPIFISWSFHL